MDSDTIQTSTGDPGAPEDDRPRAVVLPRRRWVTRSHARSFEDVGARVVEAVKLGLDVQVVKVNGRAGGWYVHLYKRAPE